jgi:hypothetical protein
LIDGSALYLAARALYEGKQLDYHALCRVLTSKVEGLALPTPGSTEHLWVMWTSASAQNTGQQRFLDFAENDLRWTVRRFNPADSFMVEPTALLGLDGKAAGRLVRFDASIGFAIGRLADNYRIVVVTDSFALAEPLLRAARLAPDQAARPVLAFFGRALDSRWQRVLRTEPDVAPSFVDLDDFEESLFGSRVQDLGKSALKDDFLIF